jgi:Tol biopolymer transport system component
VRLRAVAGIALAALAACGGAADRPTGPADPTPPADVTPAPDPCALATPGAAWVAFVSRRTGDPELFLSRADGSCEERLTDDPADDLAPTAAAGKVAFASDRGGARGVWLHDLATGAEARVEVGDLRPALPALSPDGTRLAFEGRAPGATTSDVWVVPLAGGPAIALTDDPRDDTGPAWSPDGSTLYFVSARTGAYELFSTPAGGGPATQLTTGSRVIGRPTAAAGALYHARTRAGSAATEVVRLDLSTRELTVVSGAGEAEPAISPDGGTLALRSSRFDASNADVIVMGVDGSAPARVTSDPALDGAPVFVVP